MNDKVIIDKACDLMVNGGYNCAQAIVYGITSMANEYQKIDYSKQQEYLRLAAGFGGGVAGLRQTCGYITGSVLGYSFILDDDELIRIKVKNINDKLESLTNENQCAQIISAYPDQNIATRKKECVKLLRYLLDCISIDLKDIYN